MSAHPLAVLLCAALLGPSCRAQTLLEINRQPARTDFGSSPGNFVALGSRACFTAAVDQTHGFQVWATDGTGLGTRAVDGGGRQIRVNPKELTRVGGSSLFAGLTPGAGIELMKTAPDLGSVAIVKDIYPGSASSEPNALCELAGILYFDANDGVHGEELWRSDGTDAGTYLVADIEPGFAGSQPAWLTAVSGRIVFSARTATSGRELWVTDGTPAGTRLLADLVSGGDSSMPDSFYAADSRVFYMTHGMLGTGAINVTDGTASGTARLADRDGFGLQIPSPFLGRLGSVVFFVNRDATHGPELWRSDGTPAGTGLLRDIWPGTGDSSLRPGCALGDTFYFVADDGSSGREIWRSDGSSAGTQLAIDVAPGVAGSNPTCLIAFGDRLLFGAKGTLWSSDGKLSGTVALAALQPAEFASGPGWTSFVALGTRVVLRADDGIHGTEPWVTDGTASGTTLLADIARIPAGSDPAVLGELDGKLLLVADDGVHGPEPWISDGTAAGTRMLGDLSSGAGPRPFGFARLGHRAFFFVRGKELWATDGSEAGTRSISGLSSVPLGPIAVAGNLVFFTALDSGNVALWRSDGTAVGTFAVAEFGNTGLQPGPLVAFQDRLCFAANDTAHGRELWTSDGTRAGTRLVADIYAGSASASPYSPIVHDGRLLFYAADSAGIQLWRLDSIEAAPTRVMIRPVTAATGLGLLTAAMGRLFYSDYATSGWGLWSTDGTQLGTRLVKEFASPGALYPADLAGSPQRLFFDLNDGIHGVELWVSDGTTAGTRLVRDIVPGPGSGVPAVAAPNKIVVGTGEQCLFIADDGTHGRELWISDGSASGTRMLSDVAPFALETGIKSPTAVGSSVFFVEDDGTHGSELLVVRLADLGVPLAQPFGSGCSGTAGLVPTLAAGSSPSVGNAAFALSIANARGLSPGVALLGTQRSAAQIGAGCELLVAGGAFGLPFGTDRAGRGGVAFPIPQDPALRGAELFAQAAVIDPGGAYLGLFCLSAGLQVVVGD